MACAAGHRNGQSPKQRPGLRWEDKTGPAISAGGKGKGGATVRPALRALVKHGRGRAGKDAADLFGEKGGDLNVEAIFLRTVETPALARPSLS